MVMGKDAKFEICGAEIVNGVFTNLPLNEELANYVIYYSTK